MTDPTDRDSDDATWFRAHVDPVLDAEPIADAWPAIEHRLYGDVPGGAEAARSHRIRWLAAAVVLLLAASAAVIASTRHDDADTDTVQSGEDEPTGWYVPAGLPDGWKLDSVEAAPGRKACARKGVQWSDPSRDRSLAFSFDACGKAPTEADVPDLSIPGAPEGAFPQPTLRSVDLGDGVTATGIESPTGDPALVDVASLGWNAGGGAWTVRAVGLGFDQQVEVAKRLAADPGRTDLGLGGMEVVDRWEAPERRTPEVQVNLSNPAGLQTSYHLTLPGDGTHPGGDSVLVPETIEGQPEPVLRYDTVPFWAGRFGGSWPGADLIVFRWTEGPTDAKHMITDDDLRRLLASLRPATAEEWQRFLATADRGVSPVLLTAPTLAFLATDSFPRPGEPGAELTHPTTTTTPAASTTTAPDASTTAPSRHATNDFGPVTSEPGRRLEQPSKKNRFSDLSGLEVRLRLDRTPVRAGSPVPGELLLHNRTDETIEVNECSWALTQWGIVEHGDDQPPQHAIIDCYDAPIVTIPAGLTITQRLDARADPDFYAQRADDTAPWSWLGISHTMQ